MGDRAEKEKSDSNRDTKTKTATKTSKQSSSKKEGKREDKTRDQGRSRNRDSKVEIRAISARDDVDVTDVTKDTRDTRESKDSRDNNYHVVKSLNQYTKLRNTGLVVVKYSTRWCAPCKQFAPIFEEISTKYPGTVFLEVDAEAVKHEDCDVQKVPAFKIILNGSVRRSFSGASEAEKESIERYVSRYSVQILFDGENKRTFSEEDIQRVTEYMKQNPAN